jgi:hypothetical protein
MCLSVALGRSDVKLYVYAMLICSLQIEIRAACCYAMALRAQNDPDPPRTAWNDLLMEMKWLREDFKCDIERKKAFYHDVAKLCINEAPQWRQRISSRCRTEGSDETPRYGPTVRDIPEWAREDYLSRLLRLPGSGLAPISHAEEDPAVGLHPQSHAPHSTIRTRIESAYGVRRYERLHTSIDDESVQK